MSRPSEAARISAGERPRTRVVPCRHRPKTNVKGEGVFGQHARSMAERECRFGPTCWVTPSSIASLHTGVTLRTPRAGRLRLYR